MNRFLLFVLMLALSPQFLSAQVDETKPVRVSKAVAYAKSAPLSELTARLSPDKADALVVKKEVHNELDFDKWPHKDRNGSTPNAQDKMGGKQGRGPLVGFSGQGGTGSYPPDTDGDVSQTHFVQMVNSKYNVYLKDGTKVLGPLNLSTLWASLPGTWGNAGDPIVIYDEEADRWILTQFAPKSNYTDNYELFAVSATSDPTGSYHLYAFEFNDQFNDYPKIGYWNDGYYATYNMFKDIDNDGQLDHLGAKITAVEREKMLVGDPDAGMIEFYKPNYYATMPADIDGTNLPDVGEPCPIMYITQSEQIQLWDFHADWENTGESSLTLGAILTPTNFNSFYTSVPQPNGQGLDALGQMIMNRLAYRKFDTHESMVVNHTVKVSSMASIRWYEFRKTDGDWSIYQEGTYAPGDGVHRWMASAAINADGDIALAYSVSNSSDINPSIRYTGRNDGDPLGEMTIEEVELKTGTNSQSGASRWGDYSCLNVDPSNGTDFWFTTEYNGWSTWIASFDLGAFVGPSCNAGDDAASCLNEQYTTAGTGSSLESVQWTSDGDGFFAPANALAATYIRGSGDLQNGGCTLTLTATGFDGSTAVDDMYLSLVPTIDAGDDGSITPGEAYTCQGSSNAPDGTITWTTSGDGTFSNANMLNPIYTPGTDDVANAEVDLEMTVDITEPCEFSESDEMTLSILVGLDEVENTTNLSVYPNPTSDIFTINIDGLSSGEEFTYFVYTSYGKEVYREIAHSKGNNFNKAINMSDFRAGIYFLTVTTETGNTTLKIVKK